MRLTHAAAMSLILFTGSAAHAAMTEADCSAAFQRADANNDGTLSETEASSYLAALRVADKKAGTTVARTDFMAHCQDGTFDLVGRANDAGAPLEGANSFTETQARDRALAAGFSNVSPLKKDDKGVWRGTAHKGTQNVSLAVDYKGNVVGN